MNFIAKPSLAAELGLFDFTIIFSVYSDREIRLAESPVVSPREVGG